MVSLTYNPSASLLAYWPLSKSTALNKLFDTHNQFEVCLDDDPASLIRWVDPSYFGPSISYMVQCPLGTSFSSISGSCETFNEALKVYEFHPVSSDYIELDLESYDYHFS